LPIRHPPFIAGIRAARERIVARSDEERDGFLRKRGFSKLETAKIVETVLHEEGCPPQNLFDFVQGIAALARGKVHQDARLELEGRAKRWLDWARDVESRATAKQVARLAYSRLTALAIFRRPGLPERRRARCRCPRLAGPAARLAKRQSDKLAPIKRQIGSGLSSYPQPGTVA
jgi:FAD/FMN-containing dehydrogenase